MIFCLQINQASNRLDLSQLYGDNVNELRTFTDGKLSESNAVNPTLPDADPELCMHKDTDDAVCYKSGDSRGNSNPYVTTLYTLFLRLHNLIAKDLKQEKPTASDPQLFEAARTANIAVYQKIVFEEWLPIILGQATVDRINQQAANAKDVDQTVSNEFATAGIRFYYSMMPGNLKTTRDVSYFVRQSNIIIRPLRE